MANDQTLAPKQAPKLAPVVLTVCTTCRRTSNDTSNAPDAPRAGRLLAERLAGADLPAHVELRGVECLSSCSRSCVIQLTGGEDRWSYVYGDLDPDSQFDEILDGLRAYAETHDGIVPWRARPTAFRKQSVTRLPPLRMPGVDLTDS